MRILPLIALMLFGSLAAGTAQLAVEVAADQEQFLRDEGVRLKVRITNRSGQALRLGTEKAWLSFGVDHHDGGAVARAGEVSVEGAFTLDSGQVATRHIDLAEGFDLVEPGRYTVVATVQVKEWASDISSAPKAFEIVRGTKIWEQEFGVPAAGGLPEVRRYTLLQATFKKQLRLFLRISDADDLRVFKVLPLGSMVSFSRPEAQLDGNSDLSVIFQTGARSFLFHIIRSNGDIAVRQTYDYAASRPLLKLNEGGRIYVSGGVRRFTATDFPPPPAAPATNAPAITNNAAASTKPTDGKTGRK